MFVAETLEGPSRASLNEGRPGITTDTNITALDQSASVEVLGAVHNADTADRYHQDVVVCGEAGQRPAKTLTKGALTGSGRVTTASSAAIGNLFGLCSLGCRLLVSSDRCVRLSTASATQLLRRGRGRPCRGARCSQVLIYIGLSAGRRTW